jgi:hypothetical protein
MFLDDNKDHFTSPGFAWRSEENDEILKSAWSVPQPRFGPGHSVT